MRSITFLFILGFSSLGFTQKHLVGLQAGVNLTNINTDSKLLENSDSRRGFNGGLTYQYIINKRFNLGVDLFYSQRGFNDAFAVLLEGVNWSIKNYYDYISIPLKVGIKVGNKVSGFANLGLVPSVLISAKTLVPGIEGVIEESEEDIRDRVNNFDLGGIVELGASYQLRSNLITYTSIGFQHSFTSITNDDYYSRFDIRHYVFTWSIGIQYGFK